jgi:hypothetical protein
MQNTAYSQRVRQLQQQKAGKQSKFPVFRLLLAFLIGLAMFVVYRFTPSRIRLRSSNLLFEDHNESVIDIARKNGPVKRNDGGEGAMSPDVSSTNGDECDDFDPDCVLIYSDDNSVVPERERLAILARQVLHEYPEGDDDDDDYDDHVEVGEPAREIHPLEETSDEASDDSHIHSHSHSHSENSESPSIVGDDFISEYSTAKLVSGLLNVDVPRMDGSSIPHQKVIPGERELTSHQFKEASQHSLNPPVDIDSYPEEIRQHLSDRIIVAMSMGVRSSDAINPLAPDVLSTLPTFRSLIPSFLPSAQPHHIYRFYFAFDHNDRLLENVEWRNKIQDEIHRLVREEDSKRWHPEGYTAETVDNSRLLVSVHWVHCDYSGKPSWAHSDAVMAAYKEGADYVYRTNDDSRFPSTWDWVDIFIQDLRGRAIPNLGVVGPSCHQGAHYILTHDFTHRTHCIMFGFHYPRSLPDWSSDDFITYLYKQFGLMHKREDIMTLHEEVGMRYSPKSREERLPVLNSELASGAKLIADFALNQWGTSLQYTVEHVECC